MKPFGRLHRSVLFALASGLLAVAGSAAADDLDAGLSDSSTEGQESAASADVASDAGYASIAPTDGGDVTVTIDQWSETDPRWETLCPTPEAVRSLRFVATDGTTDEDSAHSSRLKFMEWCRAVSGTPGNLPSHDYDNTPPHSQSTFHVCFDPTTASWFGLEHHPVEGQRVVVHIMSADWRDTYEVTRNEQQDQRAGATELSREVAPTTSDGATVGNGSNDITANTTPVAATPQTANDAMIVVADALRYIDRKLEQWASRQGGNVVTHFAHSLACLDRELARVEGLAPPASSTATPNQQRGRNGAGHGTGVRGTNDGGREGSTDGDAERANCSDNDANTVNRVLLLDLAATCAVRDGGFEFQAPPEVCRLPDLATMAMQAYFDVLTAMNPAAGRGGDGGVRAGGAVHTGGDGGLQTIDPHSGAFESVRALRSALLAEEHEAFSQIGDASAMLEDLRRKLIFDLQEAFRRDPPQGQRAARNFSRQLCMLRSEFTSAAARMTPEQIHYDSRFGQRSQDCRDEPSLDLSHSIHRVLGRLEGWPDDDEKACSFQRRLNQLLPRWLKVDDGMVILYDGIYAQETGHAPPTVDGDPRFDQLVRQLVVSLSRTFALFDFADHLFNRLGQPIVTFDLGQMSANQVISLQIRKSHRIVGLEDGRITSSTIETTWSQLVDSEPLTRFRVEPGLALTFRHDPNFAIGTAPSGARVIQDLAGPVSVTPVIFLALNVCGLDPNVDPWQRRCNVGLRSGAASSFFSMWGLAFGLPIDSSITRGNVFVGATLQPIHHITFGGGVNISAVQSLRDGYHVGDPVMGTDVTQFTQTTVGVGGYMTVTIAQDLLQDLLGFHLTH